MGEASIGPWARRSRCNSSTRSVVGTCAWRQRGGEVSNRAGAVACVSAIRTDLGTPVEGPQDADGVEEGGELERAAQQVAVQCRIGGIGDRAMQQPRERVGHAMSDVQHPILRGYVRERCGRSMRGGHAGGSGRRAGRVLPRRRRLMGRRARPALRRCARPCRESWPPCGRAAAPPRPGPWRRAPWGLPRATRSTWTMAGPRRGRRRRGAAATRPAQAPRQRRRWKSARGSCRRRGRRAATSGLGRWRRRRRRRRPAARRSRWRRRWRREGGGEGGA